MHSQELLGNKQRLVILRIFVSAMQEQAANLFLVALNTTHISKRKEKPVTNNTVHQMLIITEAE